MTINIPVDIDIDFFDHPTCEKCPLHGTALCDRVPTCRMVVALRGVEWLPEPVFDHKPRMIPKALQYHTDIYALRRNRWRQGEDYWYTRRQHSGHLVELRIRFITETGRYSKYYKSGEGDIDELYIKEFMKLEGMR